MCIWYWKPFLTFMDQIHSTRLRISCRVSFGSVSVD